MKASLVVARRRVRMEEDQEDPGHLVHPATILPSRSHRLNIKNPPTGTKYVCQV